MWKFKAGTNQISWIKIPQSMIQKGVTRDHMIPYELLQKPFQLFHSQNHTIYSWEDPKPLVTASLAIMIVVHFAKVSTQHPRIVISSPFDN
jgi:hypothetical protein